VLAGISGVFRDTVDVPTRFKYIGPRPNSTHGFDTPSREPHCRVVTAQVPASWLGWHGPVPATPTLPY